MGRLDGRLREKAEMIVLKFSEKMCSSENPLGYQAIVVFGRDLERRERLCEIIQEGFPSYWTEVPYVWEENYRGTESNVLYINADKF